MNKIRARSKTEMAERQQSIVDALRLLLCKQIEARDFVTMPSVDEISRQAGLTKGVVYHYFSTKEEVYLTLLSQETESLIANTIQDLQTEDFDINRLRDIFVSFCSNDLLMALSSVSATILEGNASAEFIHMYKMASISALDELAKAWYLKNQAIPLASLRQFLLRIFLIAQALWRHYNPPLAITESIPEYRTLWFFESGFKASLEETFDWLWNGASRA